MRGLWAKTVGMFATRRFFVAAAFLALCIRLAWAWDAGDQQRFWDADSYIRIADHIIAGDGFVWGDQHVGRAPLYPLLVAATRYRMLDREFLALYIVQAVLGTATVLFFSLAARRLMGRVAGGITALWLAFYPFLVYYTGAVLSETLFVFLLSVFFYYLVTCFSRPGILRAILAGAFAGAAFLTRPSVLGLVVLFAIVVIIRVRPFFKSLLVAGVMLVTAFLVALPWAVRNKRVTGRLIFSTCGIGASLYDGLGPQADGSSDMSFLHAMPELKSMDEVARDRYLTKKALEAAAKSPRRILRLMPTKAYRFWAPVPTAQGFRRPLYVWVSLAAVVPIYVMAVFAVVMGVVKWRNFALLAAAPLYFTCLHMVFVGSTRYRLGAMPFVVIMAAGAMAFVLTKGREGDAPERAHRHGRPTLPFKIFLSTLVVLMLAAAAGYAFYRHWLANPENVRAFAQEKIGHLFPGKAVTVESAYFRLFGGLDLFGVKVAEKDNGYQIVTLDQVHIDFDLKSLARFSFRIKNVSAVGLFIDLIRSQDGQWNLALPGSAKDKTRKRSFAYPLSLTLQGAFVSVDDRFKEYAVSVPVEKVNAMSGTKDLSEWRVSAEAGGDLLGSWRLSGHGNVAQKTFGATFKVIDIDLGKGLRSRMPPRARRVYDMYEPSGIADISGSAGYSRERGWNFDVETLLKGCGGKFFHFPVAVGDLVGSIHFADKGVSFDKVEGKALGGAVTLSGRSIGYGRNAGIEAQVEAKDTHITDELLAALQPKVRKEVDKFHPEGVVDAIAEIVRKEGPGKHYDVSVNVLPKGVRATYDAFPLTIEGVTGRLAYSKGDLELADLSGHRGGMKVLCNGTVMGLGLGAALDVDVRIVATSVPLEEDIRVLLPKKAAAFWKDCAASGRVDTKTTIRKKPNEALQVGVDVALRGTNVMYKDFPYQLTDGTGEFTLKGTTIETAGLSFKHNEAVVSLSGRADTSSGKANLEIFGKKVAVDAELKDALPKDWRRQVDSLGVCGEADAAFVLSRDADGTLTPRGMNAQIRNGRFLPEKMPIALGGANASVGYSADYVDIKGLEGWVFPDNSLVLMPFIRTAFLSRPPVRVAATGGITPSQDEGEWFTHFDANGLFIDDAFTGRLPESLRAALGETRIRGYTSLDGNIGCHHEGGKINADYSLAVGCEDLNLNFGKAFEQIKGHLDISGQFRNGVSTLVSKGRLESMRFEGRELGRTKFTLEKGEDEIALHSLETDVLGGRVTGEGRLSLSPGGGYGFTMTFDSLALNQVIEKAFDFRKPGLAGRAYGKAKVISLSDDAGDLIGTCEVVVRDGTLWKVPPVLAIFNVLNLQLPERTQFTEASIKCKFARRKVLVDEFSMSSAPATIFGRGKIGFDGTLDMTFYSRPGRIPVVSLVAGEIGRNIVKAQMRGSFAVPKVTLVSSGLFGKIVGWVKAPFRRKKR